MFVLQLKLVEMLSVEEKKASMMSPVNCYRKLLGEYVITVCLFICLLIYFLIFYISYLFIYLFIYVYTLNIFILLYFNYLFIYLFIYLNYQ